MLLNHAQRLIPLHEAWRTSTAARRIYRPLQVRHVHLLFIQHVHRLHILILAQQEQFSSSLWDSFRAPITNICLNTRHLCLHFPSPIFARLLWITHCCNSLKIARKSLWYSSKLGLRHLKSTLWKHSPGFCQSLLPLPTTLGGHVPGCLSAQHQVGRVASSIIPHTIPSNNVGEDWKAQWIHYYMYRVQLPDVLYHLPFSPFKCSV